MTDPKTTPQKRARKHAGKAVHLSTGAKVALHRNIRPGVNGVIFVSPEGVETKVAISDEALGALATLIMSCGKVWQIA